MPTENRSSNTDQPQIEAASAAMTQIRTMLGREQRPDQVAAALEACNWSESPIGNKAIVLSAIQVLRATQPHASLWRGWLILPSGGPKSRLSSMHP